MNLGEIKNSKSSLQTTRVRKVKNVSKKNTLDIDLSSVNKPSSKKRKTPNNNRFLTWVSNHKIKAAVSFLLIMILAGGAIFYNGKINDLRKTGLKNVNYLTPIKTVINAVAPAQEQAIDKLDQSDGKTNILVVGVDSRAKGEVGLTDSIIMMSYDHEKNEIAQISFPRDLEANFKVNGLSYNRNKLNAVFPLTFSGTNSTDETTKYNASFENLGTVVEGISGLKVHYGVLINFRGFKDIVENLGGITVDVERSFIDYQYPNDNDTGVITVQFTKGSQTLNGTKALQYARSRHSVNPIEEGTDFARARRQQKVIAAIKEKFISSNIFNKAESLNQLITTLGNNIKFYNFSDKEISIGIQSRDVLKNVKIYSMVLDFNFGSYTYQLLSDTHRSDYNQTGYILYPVGNVYTKVKEAIAFYTKNSFILQEDANVAVVWTNSKRNKDYLAAKNLIYSNRLVASFNDGLKSVVKKNEPSVTPTGMSGFGSIYKFNNDKTKTFDFYLEMFNQGNMKLESRDPANLPKELESLRPKADILIVID